MELPSKSLWAAFEDDHGFRKGDEFIHMECQFAGALVLPSGCIVACDPQLDLTQKPFKTNIPRGEYSAFLSLADGEVALVMIQFKEGSPQSWAPAVPPRFDVDSATGCLMDAKLAKKLLQKLEEDKWDRYWKKIDDAMEEHDGAWANVCLHQKSGANILAFRTWGGDGRFATYLGYSENGDLLCSVTDMFLEFGVDEI